MLLGISKRGDKHIRQLLVQGARSIMQHIDKREDAIGPWVRELLTRRHSNVVACALANKLARICYATLRDKVAFDEPTVRLGKKISRESFAMPA